MARVLTFVAAVTVVGGAAVRVSCVGDSITAGVCSSKTHGYPAVLQVCCRLDVLAAHLLLAGASELVHPRHLSAQLPHLVARSR